MDYIRVGISAQNYNRKMRAREYVNVVPVENKEKIVGKAVEGINHYLKRLEE